MSVLLDAVRLMRARHKGVEGVADAGILAMPHTGLTVAVDNSGRREVDVVFNTDGVDLDDEVVAPDGMDDTYWVKTGRKVFADHAYGLDDVVGHTRWHRPIGDGDPTAWKARVVLGRNHLGEAVKAIIEDSGTIGSSVGFIPAERRRPTEAEGKRYGRGAKFSSIVPEWLMLEFSFTAMPCNPGAMAGWAGEEGKKRYNTIESLIVKGRVRPEAAAMLGFPDAVKGIIIPEPRMTRGVIFA